MAFGFRLERRWKGGNKKEEEIYDFGEEPYIFEKEKHYLVYAFSDKAMLTTNNSKRTNKIERAR